MIHHMKTPGVGMFWINLVLRKDDSNLNTIILRFLVSLNVCESLIDLFAAGREAYHVSTWDTLEEIIRAVAWDSPLMSRLTNAQNCTKIMDYIFDVNNPSAGKYATQVFNACLGSYSDWVYANDKRLPLETPLDALPPIIKEPVSSLQAIVAFIKACPGDTVHIDSVKKEKKTFGFCRLHLYEMITKLIRLEYYIVVDTLIDDSVAFFSAAMDAFVSYEHCTFNHKAFQDIIELCLLTQPGDILQRILMQANLPADLIALEAQNLQVQADGGDPFQFMPYLRNIGNSLRDLLDRTECTALQDYIELTEGWEDYSKMLVALQTDETERRINNESLIQKKGDSLLAPGLRNSFETAEPSTPEALEDLLADMTDPSEVDPAASVDDLLDQAGQV